MNIFFLIYIDIRNNKLNQPTIQGNCMNMNEVLAETISDIVKNQAKFYELTEKLEAGLGFEINDGDLQNIINEHYCNRNDGVNFDEAQSIAIELKSVSAGGVI